MNNIQIFQNAQFGQIRTAVSESGEPLVAAIDVAKSLGYRDPAYAITAHCKGVEVFPTPTEGGVQTMKYIPESDVYRLIMRSKLPQAEAFQDWACNEIFPTIRKHGAYLTPQKIEEVLSNPDTIIMLATQLKEEKTKRAEAEKQIYQQQEVLEIKDKQIEQLQPDADYTRTVLTSKNTFTTTQIAKEFGFGAPTLNEKLRQMGVQYKQNGQWLLSYKYQDKEYVKVNTYSETINGETRTYHSTVWTEKGRRFIHELMASINIFPITLKAS